MERKSIRGTEPTPYKLVGETGCFAQTDYFLLYSPMIAGMTGPNLGLPTAWVVRVRGILHKYLYLASDCWHSSTHWDFEARIG